MSQSQSQDDRGKLFIVGTGPGEVGMLTEWAKQALRESEYVVGNKLYIDLVMDIVSEKKLIISSMGKEVDRAKKAVELARHSVVSIVSGGDPGVYGMASIVLEVVESQCPDLEVEVLPGISAANAAAARLGSPLSGDFVIMSLSNLLTPMEVIKKRLAAAFSMGVPVVIYNPKSRGRADNLHQALLIASEHRSPGTPIGVVKNAYREGEQRRVFTLEELTRDDSFVDMHSTVIIGGEESKIWREGENVKGIITPRGYHRKYVY